MNQTGYLIIAITILGVLLVTFFVSFIIYMRTPVPKGCEDIKANDEKCSSCPNHECQFYKSRDN